LVSGSVATIEPLEGATVRFHRPAPTALDEDMRARRHTPNGAIPTNLAFRLFVSIDDASVLCGCAPRKLPSVG
jgi:hypothetical protein